MTSRRLCLFACVLCTLLFGKNSPGLERIKYNHPGLVVDLGVGLWAWPLPMDYDQDGDLDLVVVCPDVPYNGTYFFENTEGNVKMPIFKPAVRIDRAVGNPQLSYVNGRPRVLSPNSEYVDFCGQCFSGPRKLGLTANVHDTQGRVRANQWKYCDFDADGRLDLIVGVGDWADYGWDNAFDASGRWINGPLHGFVYWLRNTGQGTQAEYAPPVKLTAGGKPLDVYGMPSPNLEDFDGDGDLDLICGEFLDRFSYFENVGTRQQPSYATPRFLEYQGETLHMDLQMITPTALDWDKDGDVDLIVGDEDGRVAFVENTGRQVAGVPEFLPPQYFQQQAADVKFGALVTPYSFDWDGDGDEDLICGNTAGYIGLIENLDAGSPPRWAAPVRLQANGRVIRVQAGPRGSIQGPCEAKWGYTTLSVADWNHDGLPDVVVNSIWGKVEWYENKGTRREPRLASSKPIEVQWTGKASGPKPAWNWWDPHGQELVTQWRTTPVVVDWNQDGLNDLVLLDHEGYLVLLQRSRVGEQLSLAPPRRVFHAYDQSTFDARHAAQQNGDGPLRLNHGVAGRSGRRKLCFTDWDGDGRLDLLANSVSVNFLRNESGSLRDGVWYREHGPVDQRRLAGHTTSPTVVDWDRNGRPDLLVGAEDGFLYYLENPF